MSTTKQSTKKVTATPKKAAAKKVAAKVEPVVEESKQEEIQVTPAPSKSTKKSAGTAAKKPRVRRVVTRESLEVDFDLIQKRVEDEIEKLRQSNEKVKGVKFLRSVNKAIKVLRSDSLRVLKIKPKTNRSRSTTSGFMKPVGITAEMAGFTGWDAAKLYSRVDVTKFICAYIRDNKLQNAEDRRQIICDDKLRTLLKYDPANPPMDKNGKPAPLTYFRLQQYIQPHFVKIAVEVAAEEETVDIEEETE
jgi:upstream activation factor subunit UAF30